MTLIRRICIGYFVALLGAASLNYTPGLTDDQGRSFGIFALDIYDDALHLGSALWALAAALLSHRAARIFLLTFGAIYLGDGALGLTTGSGYLDLGIFTTGWLPQPVLFRIMANLPHIALGGFALFAGLRWGRG